MGAGHRKNRFGHHLSTSTVSIRPEHRKWITPGVKTKDNPVLDSGLCFHGFPIVNSHGECLWDAHSHHTKQ